MIDVRLFAALARATDPGPPEFQVAARPGLTVRGVAVAAGVRVEDVAIVMINGRISELDSPLGDHDRVGLFPAVSGG